MFKLSSPTIRLWSAVLLGFITAISLSAKYEDKVEESFNTTGAGLLSLDLQGSPVDIDTYAGREVKITITRILRKGDKEDFEKELKNLELNFEQSGNDIRCDLEYRHENKWWNFLTNRGSSLNFQTKVLLPRQFNVDVRTSGGSIDLEALEGDAELRTSGGSISMNEVVGEVTAKTSGGSIHARNCQGDVELKTSGGSIHAADIDGSLEAKTSGGRIEVKDVKGDTHVATSGGSINLGTVQGNLDASTSGGSISATLAGQPNADCQLRTSGGGIHLNVDPSANLMIDASTSGGGVDSNLNLTTTERKRSTLRGRLNAGGPLLKARTSGGGITINSI